MRFISIFVLFGSAMGCGGGSDGDTTDDAGLHAVTITHPAAAPLPPATTCEVEVGTAALGTNAHVILCSPLTFDTKPPSHGDHYAIWADYKVYDAPVPWGYLVHDAEHGGVVIAYRCDTPCPDLVATLRTFIDNQQVDPLCARKLARHRFVLVPDPTLDVPLAAVAWGQVYRATCVDLPSLAAFVEKHYGSKLAPEAHCDDGTDRSAVGWCP
jgi:Protein of unknown function (DUF3105)